MKYFSLLKSYSIKSLKNDLIRGSFYLFLGGLLASILSFLFNLFLARTLSYSDYGIYTSLLSVFTIFTVPSTIFIVILVKFATTYFSKNEELKASALYKKSLLALGGISVFLFIVFASLSHLMLQYLHIKDVRLVLLIGLAVSLTYMGVVNTAFIRSLMKFSYNAFSLVMANLAKVLLGGALVMLGLNLFGALVGVIMVPLVVLLLGFIPLVFLLKLNTKNKKIKLNTSEIVEYSIPASITLIFLASFIAVDVILVRHFFTPDEAGLYGGLSVVGKVILYFTAPITAVMFPVVVKRHTQNRNYLKIFYMSLLLICVPSVMILAIYILFPEFVISLFLGGRRYLELSPYLWMFGLFVLIYSLLNVTVNFYLSIKKTIVAFLVPIFAILQIILIYLYHDTFVQVITMSLVSITLLLAILWIYIFRFNRKK